MYIVQCTIYTTSVTEVFKLEGNLPQVAKRKIGDGGTEVHAKTHTDSQKV
jgi:hypothetical protein